MYLLTVLFPKFFTRQFRYAVLPSSAVTFFDRTKSKYGPVRGVGRGASGANPALGPAIALSAAGADVAEEFAEVLPSSRCADDTVDN